MVAEKKEYYRCSCDQIIKRTNSKVHLNSAKHKLLLSMKQEGPFEDLPKKKEDHKYYRKDGSKSIHRMNGAELRSIVNQQQKRLDEYERLLKDLSKKVNAYGYIH